MCTYARSLPENFQDTRAGTRFQQGHDHGDPTAAQHARAQSKTDFTTAHERRGADHGSMLPCLPAALAKTITLVATTQHGGTPNPTVRIF